MVVKWGWMFTLGCMLYAPVAMSANSPFASFGEAQKVWHRLHTQSTYAPYYQSFLKKNEGSHLEKWGNCYDIKDPSNRSIQMMLVVTHVDGQAFGVIVQALPNSTSARAECFIESYVGVELPIPPSTPYVLAFQFKP